MQAICVTLNIREEEVRPPEWEGNSNRGFDFEVIEYAPEIKCPLSWKRLGYF